MGTISANIIANTNPFTQEDCYRYWPRYPFAITTPLSLLQLLYTPCLYQQEYYGPLLYKKKGNVKREKFKKKKRKKNYNLYLHLSRPHWTVPLSPDRQPLSLISLLYLQSKRKEKNGKYVKMQHTALKAHVGILIQHSGREIHINSLHSVIWFVPSRYFLK